LLRFFPQIFELGSIYADSWLLELLEHAPTPEEARTLRLPKIRWLLEKHRIRRLNAVEVHRVLHKTPLCVAPGVTAACRAHIRLLLPQLRLVQTQLEATVDALKTALDDLEQQPSQKKEHRDVTIIRSLPGAGTIVAATMLAEARDALVSRDYHRLRVIAGTAPVTRQSGKSSAVSMRRACNPRLRTAVHFLAATIIRYDARFKALYASHRQRGHSHPHALRVIADRALKMLVTMLRTDNPYDENKRVA